MQLEQRLGEADRVERTCQQRLAELADFEANLRGEFEEQERKLIRDQQELEGLWESARRERTRLASEQADLNRRQHAVEEAEKAGRQRQQEQDAFQERLEEVCQTLAQHHATRWSSTEELDIRERPLVWNRETPPGNGRAARWKTSPLCLQDPGQGGPVIPMIAGDQRSRVPEKGDQTSPTRQQGNLSLWRSGSCPFISGSRSATAR